MGQNTFYPIIIGSRVASHKILTLYKLSFYYAFFAIMSKNNINLAKLIENEQQTLYSYES